MREIVVKVTCDKCGMTGTVEGQFENLEVSVGGRTLEMDLCINCAEKLFDSFLQGGREMPKTTEGAAQPTETLECPDCGKGYRGKSGLNKHRRAKHPEIVEAESDT